VGRLDVNGGTENSLNWADGGEDRDSKAKFKHDAPGHELFGAVEVTKFHGKHRHDVAPVSAIPEPSTYALLAAGLAGIAVIMRHRRRGN